MAIKVVEVVEVSPSEGAADQQLLPLLHFDIARLGNILLHYLNFYSLECSESHFLDTIVPNLKKSLSLTLKHFLPLSGKIVLPLASGMPFSRYVGGEDAVALKIAVSGADFGHLAGNHRKNADELGDFVPLQLFSTTCSDSIRFSCLAIQVTLFPNQGVCIAQTFHHAMADGTSMLDFQQAWASIHKFNGDAHCQKLLPSYGRSIVADTYLAVRAWNHMKSSRPIVSSTISSNAVTAIFALSVAEIQKLRNLAQFKKPGPQNFKDNSSTTNISSLVAVVGFVWSCFTKSAAAAGEEVGDDEIEYLTCPVNCRARLCPPLPPAYFGNCVALALAVLTHGTLKGKEGSVAGAHAIEEALRNFSNGTAFNVLEILLKVKGKRVVKLNGSPRYDIYGIDYGWGRAQNSEFPTGDTILTICKARENEGMEIRLCVPKVKTDAFAAFFHQGIREATQSLHMNSSL